MTALIGREERVKHHVALLSKKVFKKFVMSRKKKRLKQPLTKHPSLTFNRNYKIIF